MHDLYIAKSTVFSVPFPLDLLGVCSAGATLRSWDMESDEGP